MIILVKIKILVVYNFTTIFYCFFFNDLKSYTELSVHLKIVFVCKTIIRNTNKYG